MNLKQIFLALLFCTASLFACSNTYYLSPSGNDLNSGTSIAQPLATLAQAVSLAVLPGDSILVRSGTYSVSSTIYINSSGTVTNHIVLSVYMPDIVNASSRPVFDFSSMVVSSANRGITLTSVSYFDIYGIIIKGAGDNGMFIGQSSHHVNIEFCSFTRNRDSGFQIGSGSHHCKIINCDSYENADMGTGATTAGGNADGFAPKIDCGDSIIFTGCRSWLNSDDGFDGYLKTADTTTFHDNMTTFLEDCWTFKNGYYWLKPDSTNAAENGNGFKMGGSTNKDQAHNFVLVRCLSFKNKAVGFDQNNNAGSIYLYNCSAHQNGTWDYYLSSSGVKYKTGAVLKLNNNLSLGTHGVSIRTAGSPPTSTPVTNVNNHFVTGSTSTNFISLDSTGVTAPRNADGSLPIINYMHLQTSPLSSYVNSGTALPTVFYHDALGVPYNGTALDIGAFETDTTKSLVYIFTGNGNWNILTNWKNNLQPHNTVPAGTQIIINPIWSGECLLNIPYTLSPGASIFITSGKKFRVPNSVDIAQ